MTTRRLIASLVIALALTFTLALWAQEAPPSQPAPAQPAEPITPPPEASPGDPPPLRDLTAAAVEAAPEAATPAPTSPTAPAAAPAKASKPRRPPIERSGDAMVVFNRDATLEATSHRDAVVAIGGSSTTYGDVADAVVSILGDTRVEGRVGDAAVSILGNTTVNGQADTVVAVLGGVVLGPNAVVHDVVSVGGPIQRAPGAKVTGESQEIGFLSHLPDFTGFRAWIRNALFWGRPLAIADNLGWAWGVAAVFLGLYLLLAALFPRAVEKCAETLETRPGRTLLASIICMVLTPIFMVLLAVTVVGPLLAGAALTFATFIGKAALLAWLGRRLLFGAMEGSRAQVVLAVAIGGLVLTALYLIPVVGLVLWKIGGVLSLGLAVYTLILSSRRPRPAATPGPVVRPGPAAYAAPRPAASSFSAPMTSTSSGFGVVAGAAGAASETSVVDAVPSSSIPVSPEAPTSPPLADSGYAPLPAAVLPRAGFWIRVGALAIDVVVVGAAASLISAGSLFLLLLATYGAVMWKLRGTTIGGIVCGLKVVRLDERPVDWTTSIVRALASFLSLFAAGLGFLWIAFDRERQSWHDKIAGTAVVQLPQGTPLV